MPGFEPNYFTDVRGYVGNSDEPLSWWELMVTNPVRDWFDSKVHLIADWFKINTIDLLGVILAVLIIYTGLRLFLYPNSKKGNPHIVPAIIIYIIVRLIWRIDFHV
jgi:hypothetical protein